MEFKNTAHYYLIIYLFIFLYCTNKHVIHTSYMIVFKTFIDLLIKQYESEYDIYFHLQI